MLQAQHQLDQLRLRKPLEFLPIHRQDESYTGHLGKGVGNYPAAAKYSLLNTGRGKLSGDFIVLCIAPMCWNGAAN